MAMGSEATLRNQERDKDWEYKVIAVNKADEDPAGNAIMAVL